MDLSDFEGLFFLKMIVPAIYLVSWTTLLFGQTLFPTFYYWYTSTISVYLLYKVFQVPITISIGLRRTYRTLGNLPKKQQKPLGINAQAINSPTSQRFHIFVIPNYHESLQLLTETVSKIAEHSIAQTNYIIYLAMEKEEINWEVKARKIWEQFRGSFYDIRYTVHQMRDGEQRGKAANVLWCVENINQLFAQKSIDSKDVFLTIIDADSWVPGIYIQEVNKYLDSHPQRQYLSIFAPPQIFTRNNEQIPFLARVSDHSHSLAHFYNLQSCSGISFPLSNYTISYQLVKRIGFWDTCQDAIGQDFHMFQKAFWKTGGAVLCVPIYVAFNQLNVQMGTSYWNNLKAKFWQLERHFEGVTDVAYCIKMMFKHRVFTIKAVILVYSTLEAFSIAISMPWLLYIQFQQIKLILWPEHAEEMSLMSQFLANIAILNIITVFVYECFKRHSNTVLYQQKNESLWRIVEAFVVWLPNIVAMILPSLIIGAFRVMCKKGKKYVVAVKNPNPTQIDTSNAIVIPTDTL